MVKVDYISTKDINKVAKIHSSKKYFNWIMKIIDNEYRFYPPLIIEDDEDYLDDFEFDNIEEDTTELDTVLVENKEEEKTPMFGELWTNTAKFFTEDRFNFVGVLDSKMNKKMYAIKKGMSTPARIEQYKEKEIKISRCGCAKINKNKFIDTSTATDTYKLYRVKQYSNCLAKIDKYKEEDIQEQLRNLSEVVSEKVTAKMKDLFKKKDDEIELLSFDEEYA